MVQVDIFWSYGIGAGFAVAASRQLVARSEQTACAIKDATQNPFFTKNLLFLALIFAPSGGCLLWAFTSWETMHALDRTLPAWLATGFMITNVTQGILGFLVADALIRKGKPYLAFLQVPLAYFAMFFILVHGWDGTGYQRFFSPDKASLLDWTWSTAGGWLASDVALTLYGMGVIMLPIMLGMMARWVRAGIRENVDAAVLPPREGMPSVAGRVIWFLVTVLGATLGFAIAASLFIHWMGWIGGALSGLALFTLVGMIPGGIFHRLYGQVVWVKR